jgi:hypothetical protein
MWSEQLSSGAELHTVEGCTNKMSKQFIQVGLLFFWAIRKHSISIAPQMIRGKSADKLQKTIAEVRGRRPLPGEHQPLVDQSFLICHSTCTAEYQMKNRGISAGYPRKINRISAENQRKIRGRPPQKS